MFMHSVSRRDELERRGRFLELARITPTHQSCACHGEAGRAAEQGRCMVIQRAAWSDLASTGAPTWPGLASPGDALGANLKHGRALRRAGAAGRSGGPRGPCGPLRGPERPLVGFYARGRMPERSCPRSWTSGCRCSCCHGRLLESARLRRAVAAVRAGRQPELRVDARRARRQLARLRARGLSVRQVAELSGVSVGTLQHLAVADRAHVTMTTERRLLTVRC